MTNFDEDNLPPDLDDLGRRMRDERPTADDASLTRMFNRSQAPSRPARRAPRRTLAVSLATMLAMVSVTGVAAAALFGISLGGIGNALTNSTQKIGATTSQALTAPAASTPARPSAPTTARIPAIGGSPVGSAPSTGGIQPVGGAALGTPAGPSASLIPGRTSNAGVFQYGPGRLVCRILRGIGLNFVANLLGCQ